MEGRNSQKRKLLSSLRAENSVTAQQVIVPKHNYSITTA